MISKRDITYSSQFRDFILAYVRDIVASIPDASALTFVDELYTTASARTSVISNIGRIPRIIVHGSDFLEHARLRSYFSATTFLSAAVHAGVPDLYEKAQSIANQVIEHTETLTGKIAQGEQILSKAESTLKRRIGQTSLKREEIVYDDFSLQAKVDGDDVVVDRRGGYLILKPVATQVLPYRIESITCNQAKGSLGTPVFGDPTMKSVTPGYFNSRMFSTHPVFETSSDKNINRICDDDLETSYCMEYVSAATRSLFTMTIVAICDAKKVDAVTVTVDPPDTTATMSSILAMPYLSKLQASDGTTTQDCTVMNTVNQIAIQGSRIGSTSRTISHVESDLYPTARYMVQKNDCRRVVLELSMATPQEIYYPEKRVLNDNGHELYRLNYFETLVANGYEPEIGRPDPKSWYTEEERTRIFRMIESGNTTVDEKIRLLRYAIAVKELKLQSMSYTTKGVAESENLNITEDPIASIELFVNEYCPPRTAITYYISPDKSTWYEVSPSVSVAKSSIPHRIVYDGIELRESDQFIQSASNQVFLRIVMEGNGTVTPLLRSYAVRIKLQ